MSGLRVAGSGWRAARDGQRGADAMDVPAGRSAPRRRGARNDRSGERPERWRRIVPRCWPDRRCGAGVRTVRFDVGRRSWLLRLVAQSSRGPTSYTTFYTQPRHVDRQARRTAPHGARHPQTQIWVSGGDGRRGDRGGGAREFSGRAAGDPTGGLRALSVVRGIWAKPDLAARGL